MPVVVEQEQGGQVTWSFARETATPALFVTYSIVQADAHTYMLQVTTHATADGPPLSVSQVRVDRASGKALRERDATPKGLSPRPTGRSVPSVRPG